MENYFSWDTKHERSNKVYVLVIYDIVSNKRRAAFAKKMNGYGFRVQKSAFEAMISLSLYNKLLNEIPKLIDFKEDNIRVYKMVGYGEVKTFGNSILIKDEEVIII